MDGTCIEMPIEVVKKRMEDGGISEDVREEPNTGQLVFWSDMFLQRFIKRKETSWILSGGRE